MAKIHIHTKYSLLDSIIEPEQLVKLVKEQDGDNAALCVTEHGNLYSNIEVYKFCKQYGVKYLLGCEMYICEDVNIKSKDSKYNHLVVIAKNETGRLNLNKLVSESCKYKYYGKPRIDFSMLCQYKNGLIVLSACMAGEVQRALFAGDYTQAKIIAQKYRKEFFDDYYLEYQSHSDFVQQELNAKIVKLAKELDIKFVVTTDAHYLKSDDQKYHNIFVQIGQAREVGETYNDCYVQSDDEILNICTETSMEDNIIAIQNTNEIADKCNVELPLSDPIMQHIDVPDGFNSEIDYLKSLCIKGWYDKKIDKKPNKNEYKKRLAYEIHAIEQMGFEWYFLFVHSYANSVKRRGIARGCFTGDAWVQTKNGLKNLKEVVIGDEVISDDNKFHKVVNTYKYKINEALIQFKSRKQSDIHMLHTNTCTFDHKILVYKNNDYKYIEANKLKVGDILCSPKIQLNTKNNYIVYDLVKYNYDNFNYDENYIYETVNINIPFKYSKRDIHRNTGLSRNCINDIYNEKPTVRNDTLKRFFEYVSFDSVLEWKQYIDKNKYIHRKVPRYITIDEDMNFFFGCMYCDGTVRNYDVSLALNSQTHKATINKDIFYKVAQRFNAKISESHPKNKNIIIVYAYSKIMANLMQTILFKSKKGKDKKFNTKLLNQKMSCLKALYKGFLLSDGSIQYYNGYKMKYIFSNTSISLISAYKILNSTLGYRPVNILYRTHKDTIHDNWKDSYALETSLSNNENYGVYDLGKYWGLEIIDMNIIPKTNNYVYDLQIEECHSYTINNIIVHNSAGGSLVCYLSNITDIDPIEYKLYFERFIDVSALELLKEKRITKKQLKIPDCDLDFGKHDRDRVFQHVINQYGQDKVACLGTFQYIWAKGAIKDIGKVLNIPFEVTNKMTSKLDKESIKEVIELGLLDNYKEEYPELFEYAERLAGLPKSFSAHPCGRCACEKPVVYYNATDINDSGEVILQGDMHTAEDLGLVKADFLGLRTIDVIYDTLDMIGKDYEYIAPHNLNFEDKKIFENFRNGYTAGVFQFESPGMRDTLKKIECSSLEDLIVSNALFRPGSIKYIDNYANRKKGTEQFEYLHKNLKPILQNTFGIIVFQEQLIEIGRMAGLSNPDELRKATAKKKASLLDKIKPELFNGLSNRGWTDKQLNTLWEIMLDFASYSFNRCISGNTKIIMNHFTNYDEIDSTYDSPFYSLYLNVNSTMISVEDLYYNKYPEYNSGITLSMFPDGNIRQNRIIDIKQSGIRKIYRVTTDNDKWIDCTINHKFPTPKGEKKLYELNIGDELYTFNYLLYGCYQYSNTNKDCVKTASIIDIEYIKEEMTYDITMDNPAHNFVANNGIITSNSHSAAYAIIAYICMFLKTYHTKEFLCAWTNSVSNKTEKVAECVEEINRLQIPIYLGKYNDCSSDCKVYKDGIMMGIKTIKYCNSEIANELMNLPTAKSFIEMLDNISNTPIDARQLNVLIGLNFFSDYGNNTKLLQAVKLYNGISVKSKNGKSTKTVLPALRTCKQIKKEKIEQYAKYGLTEAIVQTYANKDTKKQYSKIDNIGLLNEMIDKIKTKPMKAIEQIKFDMEYLQYTTYINSSFSDDYYIVVGYKTYKDETKPIITLRNIKTGRELKTRIKQSKIYKQNPFGMFSMLQVFELTPYPKKKLINGKWQNSDEEELILENYDVLKR